MLFLLKVMAENVINIPNVTTERSVLQTYELLRQLLHNLFPIFFIAHISKSPCIRYLNEKLYFKSESYLMLAKAINNCKFLNIFGNFEIPVRRERKES